MILFFSPNDEYINVNVKNGRNGARFASVINIRNFNFRKIIFYICGMLAYEFGCICVCDNRANIVFR